MNAQSVDIVSSIPLHIVDDAAKQIQTYFGQINLVQSITFGDLLLAFLMTILIVLMLFRIIQSAL